MTESEALVEQKKGSYNSLDDTISLKTDEEKINNNI